MDDDEQSRKCSRDKIWQTKILKKSLDDDERAEWNEAKWKEGKNE